MFFLRGGVPLDLSVFLGRKGNPRSEQGFSFLPKTHLPFLALLRAAALRTCMGSTERVVLPKFLRKFAFRKLGANRRPNYICKTDFHCSPCSKIADSGARRLSIPLLERCRQHCSKFADTVARKVPTVVLEHCRYLHSMPLPCTAG